MSSVSASFKQNLTRSFVTTQDTGGGGVNGAYVFTQNNIDSWLSGNASDLSVVGSLITVIGDAPAFYNVVNNLNYDGTYDARKTLLDLGKEIIIGCSADSRLLVLRKVRAYGPAYQAGDDGKTGYIVVENNTTDLAPSNWGRFTVRVARV
jgi:hypothetical protein